MKKILLSEVALVKWHPRNKQHLESKGYIFTKIGNEIEVKVEDLMPNSTGIIKVLCDYCKNEIIGKEYQEYIKQNEKSIIHKDCCKKCKGQKEKEVFLLKYGVEHPSKLLSIREKMEETNKKRYGVNYTIQSPTIKEKIKQTNLARYGFENPLLNQEIRKKASDTTKQRYGVENLFFSKEFQDKLKKDLLETYGVTNVMQLPQVKEKAMKTLYNNGTQKASTQQRYLCNLLNGELNYPIKTYSLDIAFPDEKIYIEYDGSGHDMNVKTEQITRNEFEIKQTKRWYSVKNQGLKEIRIISNKDYLPLDDMIFQMINDAKEYLSTGHSWIVFDIDKSKLICSQYEKEYNFGELRNYRRIKKELQIKEGDALDNAI